MQFNISFAKDIVIIVFLTDGQLCDGSSVGGNMEKWKTRNRQVRQEPSERLRISIVFEQKCSEVHSAQPVDIR
ncbi:hypothetical protein ANN_18829 [Periplaneta americana]|uniref:Uncharacterized protein n=1 Tax=Periplaneta americana TaxID=6978 RepID=A0ABQ8SPU7_PERAM|nr:hypothetical protein ANN_18829 [Periplaneta americana]